MSGQPPFLFSTEDSTEEMREKFLEAESVIKHFMREIERVTTGRECRLTELAKEGKGRLGVIKGCSLVGVGDIRFLFYVYRLGSRELLNSEPWTRQYRPWSHFTLED